MELLSVFQTILSLLLLPVHQQLQSELLEKQRVTAGEILSSVQYWSDCILNLDEIGWVQGGMAIDYTWFNIDQSFSCICLQVSEVSYSEEKIILARSFVKKISYFFCGPMVVFESRARYEMGPKERYKG